MKEPFDKKLAKKIRDSFESHDEPYNPKEWDKFSGAYFGKSRKTVVGWWYWLGGIAASLVLIGVLWNPFRSTDPISGDASLLTHRSEEGITALESQPRSTDQPNPTSESAGIEPKISLGISENSGTEKPTPPVRRQMPAEEDAGRLSFSKESNSRTDKPTENLAGQSSGLVEQPQIAQLPPANPLQANPQPTIGEVEEAQQQINAWLAAAGNTEDGDKIDEKTKRPLKLGVLMAPQTISNSTQNVNFGAGLMSEIAFSKRLRLDVGVGYAKQNLVPDQNNGGSLLMADVAGIESSKANSFASNYINSSSELSFGQVEIPLNMKYSVIQRKSADFYLVSGLSNMFYLNQEKTTTFNSVAFGANATNNGTQSLSSRSISESPADTGGQMDIGQLINLGMGFEQNLKNGTSISFEPFYKFTIGDQTFANQRFAIGGINLRMNFQLKK